MVWYTERIFMSKNEKKIIKSIWFSKENIEFIASHPGNNFTNKLENLLRIYKSMIDYPEIENLEAIAYERLSGRYLSKFHPLLHEEIEKRREKLNHYQELLIKIDDLNTLAEIFQNNIERLNEQVVLFIENNFPVDDKVSK